jgi:hypothetical protein
MMLDTMERRPVLPRVNYLAYWQGPETASGRRHPLTGPDRSQVHTEHTEGHHDHQKCRRPELN